MSKAVPRERQFKRLMLRSEFQSLFWHALLTRKRESKFTLKALADKLGINRSYVTRSFSSPPNWTIDKISDMADALDLDLIVEARDRSNSRLYTPTGTTVTPHTEARPQLGHAPEAELSSFTRSDFPIGATLQVRETA